MEQHLLLESDTGQFVVEPADGEGQLVDPAVPDNSLLMLDSSDRGWLLVVFTGSQGGPFDVTARLHDATPRLEADVGAGDWEDVAEVSVETDHGLVVDEVPNVDPVYIAETGGPYRIRVSARGRMRGRSRDDDPDWDNEDDQPPAEHYLIDVWPAPAAAPVVIAGCGALDRRVATLHFDDLPEFAAGLAAARTMTVALTDVAAGHRLTGARGELSVERVVPWAQRRLYRSFAYSTGWILGAMVGGDIENGTSWRHLDHDLLAPKGGHIQLDLVESQPPRRALMKWTWVGPRPGEARAMSGRGVPVLDEPTLFETTVEQLDPDENGDRCLARIQHRNLPVEWIEPMRAYWKLHLAIVENREQLNSTEAHARKEALLRAAAEPGP